MDETNKPYLATVLEVTDFFIYLSKANIHNCQSHEQVKTPIFPFVGTIGTILHGTFCVNAIFFSTPSISLTD